MCGDCTPQFHVRVCEAIISICNHCNHLHFGCLWSTKYTVATCIQFLFDKNANFSYKLIAILRRQYHIILTASWEKIYSVLGSIASWLGPIRNLFSPNAVNIMWYCCLKIAISFVSRSISYKDKWNCKLINPHLIEISSLSTCETYPW